MRATSLNHVSISAINLEESVNFYTTVLGMSKLDTYSFGFPTQYLRLGDVQLHIFERPTAVPLFHHIGLNVDNFEDVYQRARKLGILDDAAFFSPIYELPDGSVQLYLRDPGGNLVELDWPDVRTLDRNIVGVLPKLADRVAQSEQGMRATLYHLGRPASS